MITRDLEILRNLSVDAVKECIDEFMREVYLRRATLKEYYDGQHAISHRVRTAGLPNTRISVSFPKYITSLAAGYMLGQPIVYKDYDASDGLERLIEAYDNAQVDAVDSELAIQQSVYGVGLECLYMNERSMPASAAVDPRSGFVVYDDTVKHLPLFGVMWRKRRSIASEKETVAVDVFTETERISYSGNDFDSLAEVGERGWHPFVGVPMVEYWNNSDESGDFEQEISMIDAYDTLYSDRLNDKQQYADSMIVFTGIGDLSSTDPDDNRSVGQRLREDKAIIIPDQDAKVQWLTKQAGEYDTQSLALSLRDDIHKMTMVPDVSDKEFAGNNSGVALKYKLMPLEQLIKVKERWMREGLRQRLALYSNALVMRGFNAIDVNRVSIIFKRGLPVNELETAQMVETLRGIVPDTILLAQIPFVDDPVQAESMMRRQDSEKTETQRQSTQRMEVAA
ncbi:hypothetical protein FACS1894184_20570 [Clostridia bacterium]|nr:hypothetical protein FACS1894184_20570 [Clostridia bacterium]